MKPKNPGIEGGDGIAVVQGRPCRPGGLIRGLTHCLGAVVLAAPAPALATQICKDEWGRTYRMGQAMQARLAGFECEVESPPPAPSLAAAVNVPARDVAAVAGARQAHGRASPRGRLVLVSEGRRTRVSGDAPATSPPDDRFDRLIVDAARRYDHDADLLRAIVEVESGFNADAVSPKGAIGLMQLMPATARAIGVATPERSLFDPQTNLLAGARHLRQLLDRFADRVDLALAAYNAGEAAVVRHRGQVPPYAETQSYVQKVQARLHWYRRP